MVFIRGEYINFWQCNSWRIWLNLLGWDPTLSVARPCVVSDCCEQPVRESTPTGVENSDALDDISDEDVSVQMGGCDLRLCRRLYVPAVTCILLWRPLYYFWQHGDTLRLDQCVARLAFESIPALMHVFGIQYFRSVSFNTHMAEISPVRRLSWCSLFSTVGAVLHMVASDEYALWRVCMSVVNVFLSIGVVTTYLYVFNVVFCYHTAQLKNIQINSRVETALGIPTIHINAVVIQIQKFKRELNNSVRSFGHMFNATSTFGGLGCALVLNRVIAVDEEHDDQPHLDVEMLVFIALFWVVQALFYYTASSVYYFQERISETLNSTYFTHTCLKRSPTIGGRRLNHASANIRVFENTVLMRLEEAATTVDWLVLTHTLSKNFCHFKVLGVSVHKWETFERIVVFVAFAGLVQYAY